MIAVYTAIFCFAYVLIYHKKLQNKDTIKKILLCVILILLCSSFYWVPLLEHKFATEYEVFLPERMYKESTLTYYKLSVSDLFFTENFDLNFHIGLAILLGMVLTLCYRKKLSKKQKETFAVFLIFGMISIMMTLKMFPFEYMPSILKMIQFPWRMLEFATFFFSIISGFGFAYFMNHASKKEIGIVIFTMLYLCISIIGAKQSVQTPFNEEKYLQPIPVTPSTGRVHAGCATFEYLPKKAFQNREYIEQRSPNVNVLEGNAIISHMQKENTNLSVTIEQVEENTKLELPYIFYLGYRAKLQKEDGTKQNIKIEESENGFCMVNVSNIEKATIQVSYTGTVWMKLSYILTLMGIGGMVWIKFRKLT